MVIEYLLALIVCFLLTLLFGKPIIYLCKKARAEQAILSYVDNHNGKKGTPTMGGIMFILPVCVVTLCFGGYNSRLALVAVGALLSYGIVGFLDDFIKIRNKRNQGLKAYQKIIAETGIAVILTAYCYTSDFIGSTVVLPFTDMEIDFGWWYLPVCFTVYIASTNAVNLTDGLDGLAGSTSAVCFATFAVMLTVASLSAGYSGDTLLNNEIDGLTLFVYSLTGAMLAFLWYNSHPAKIFMGDTGSLALGGSLATVALFMRNPFIILILGIIYVVTSISVIIQVIYFKLTHGKRIFIMSPLHHHLQYKGYKESKIVAMYTIITAIAGAVTLISIC